jgi:hypothetical protein
MEAISFIKSGKKLKPINNPYTRPAIKVIDTQPLDFHQREIKPLFRFFCS